MTPSARSGWHDLLATAVAWQLRPDEISPSGLQEGCSSWLSGDERSHWEKLQTERLRHEYIAARALCRATLSRYTGVDPSDWRFGRNMYGKPKITRPAEFTSLRFNLAHTAGLVVCLVSRAGDVGVDAEDTSRIVDVDQMARHFLAVRARSFLESVPTDRRNERFYEQWVLKEAYLKGIGKGIASAPERSTISFGENDQPMPIGSWTLFLHRPSARHVAAAAVRQRPESAPVTVNWLNADDLPGVG
ncbi:MAG TPA: 4'-phosphopantetheinyl transferase superfamily protein [Candidatus Eremiobacteraceae bacterium]